MPLSHSAVQRNDPATNASSDQAAENLELMENDSEISDRFARLHAILAEAWRLMDESVERVRSFAEAVEIEDAEETRRAALGTRPMSSRG